MTLPTEQAIHSSYEFWIWVGYQQKFGVLHSATQRQSLPVPASTVPDHWQWDLGIETPGSHPTAAVDARLRPAAMARNGIKFSGESALNKLDDIGWYWMISIFVPISSNIIGFQQSHHGSRTRTASIEVLDVNSRWTPPPGSHGPPPTRKMPTTWAGASRCYERPMPSGEAGPNGSRCWEASPGASLCKEVL